MAPTTGLDESTRKILGAITPPNLHAAPSIDPVVRETKAEDEPVRYEAEGYTADALRLARVHYKQARYSKALEVLAGDEGPEPTYWRARCLERLGRYDEALEAYLRVARVDFGSRSDLHAAKLGIGADEDSLSGERRMGPGPLADLDAPVDAGSLRRERREDQLAVRVEGYDAVFRPDVRGVRVALLGGHAVLVGPLDGSGIPVELAGGPCACRAHRWRRPSRAESP